MCLSLDHHRASSAQRSPGGRERPGAARGLPAGSARAPAGRRFGGAQKPRRAPGPTRSRRGGSVRSRGCTRIPARLPGPFPRGNGAKGRLLPNNSDLHSRNNAGGEPRAAGREPESREAGSAAPPAREPPPIGEHESGETRRSGEQRSRGERARGPVGVAARGEARRAWPNCPAPPAGPALQLQPGRGWERGRRHKAAASGAMNRAFSQCVVQAWPPRARVRGRGPARPEPAAVTQGRPRSPGSRPGVLRPPVPLPGRHSAQPPLGDSGLARRLGSAAAAPVTATPRLRAGPAPPRSSAPAPRRSPACPCCRNGSGDVSTRSLGLGPG